MLVDTLLLILNVYIVQSAHTNKFSGKEVIEMMA